MLHCDFKSLTKCIWDPVKSIQSWVWNLFFHYISSAHLKHLRRFGKILLNTCFKCILETQLQVRALAMLCKRMDMGMWGTKEKVPFKMHLMSSINDFSRQSSRARSFNGTHILFGSALIISSLNRGQRKRGLISIKVGQRELLFALGMVCNINTLVFYPREWVP